MLNDFAPRPFIARDGERLLIRPIHADDGERLQELTKHLSASSIYYRFLTLRNTLTADEVQRLTHIDYDSHMALVATPDQADAPLLGVARYITSPDHVGLAEIGVIVQDAHQKRGIGTALLTELAAYARTHAVQSFSAAIHVSNQVILNFLTKSTFRTERRLDGAVWEVLIHLHEPLS